MCGCGMANHGMGYVQCAEALRTDSGMRRAEQRTLIQDFNKKSEKAERTLRRLLLDWNVKKNVAQREWLMQEAGIRGRVHGMPRARHHPCVRRPSTCWSSIPCRTSPKRT